MTTQDTKRILKIISLGFLFFFIIFYSLFISKDLILGIKIRDVTILDGALVEESVLLVRGNARHALKLTLNGREISIDQEGDFNETIALLSGFNVINIKAEDKFGNIDEKNYQLIYSPNQEEPQIYEEEGQQG